MKGVRKIQVIVSRFQQFIHSQTVSDLKDQSAALVNLCNANVNDQEHFQQLSLPFTESFIVKYYSRQ